MFNVDNFRSYATEEQLINSIVDIFGLGDKYVVVRNREGRFTPIFPARNPFTLINSDRIKEERFMVLG